MTFLTLLTALALSGVAAYYSVIGLAAIFPGSFWPVVIMGSVLEISKLVTVSWLYRNWKIANFGMKLYLSSATFILMLITSMGIFGYLSKAHLEHSSDLSPLVSKVSLLEEKIKTQKDIIDESRKELKQLDEIVNQTVGRTTDEKGVDKAQTFRKSQQKDRNRLVSQIEQSQKNIALYREELAPISVELKKAEADLGPIKYVAALVYGEEDGVAIVEKTVRLVIGLIIVVFDPLAILLLIAANMSFVNGKKKDWTDFFNKQPNEKILDGVVEKHEKETVQEFQKEETKDVPKDKVEIQKDNLITIDGATDETIPPITTKYDYNEAYSFKKKLDSGHF